MAPKPKTFATILSDIPFTGKTAQGAGFLPPFLRTLTHFFTIMQFVAEEKDQKGALTAASVKTISTELDGAIEHFKNVTLSDFLSTSTQALLKKYADLIMQAKKEIPDWTPENTVENMDGLVRRGMQIASVLDRELIGLTNSDAGTQL